MARPRPPNHHHPLLLLAAILVASGEAASSAAGAEGDVLLAFRDTLHAADGSPPPPLRAWGTPGPCAGNISQWHGVTCHGNGSVHGLHLDHLRLAGAAPDVTPLSSLPGLRVLSLADNALAGAFPTTVSAIPALKMLYLSNNRLDGVIPDATFAAMRGLRKLHLDNNDFSGKIPSSITSPRLLELSLANNRFDGSLPDFSQPELRFVDVSGNNLSGPIPDGLSRFNASMFAGNEFLCGKPLDVACDAAASPAGMSTFMTVAIVLIIVGVILAAAGIATCVSGRRNRSRRPPRHPSTTNDNNQTPSSPKLQTTPAVNIENTNNNNHKSAAAASTSSASGGGAAARRAARREEHGRLVFMEEGRKRFEIEDLLRASAEVLGSGNFGSSYKATMVDGAAVVVKRFKDMNGVGREDFSEHMRRLGRLSHPNLLPIVAYLYKKDEKLLITDYSLNGSLAHLLHGNRGKGLDWGRRLRIIKGTVRGLDHLYDELPMMTVPHGHLKSSNVLVNGEFEAALTDYALVPVVTPPVAAQVMVAYKSPECVSSPATAKGNKPSKKSDVWSLGILILEVLTGKFPPASCGRVQGRQGTAPDLAGWVASVVGEERTGEVFDKDMAGAGVAGVGDDMLKLLHVGLACCEADVDKRWDIKTALARIEEIRDPDSSAAAAAAGGGEPSTSSTTTNSGEARS
uniref:Protein kinase domain-containing protein n=1 Tax=Leersia perrieri TaxID=77586 RepID=A0A0D9VCT1_9ORYZ